MIVAARLFRKLLNLEVLGIVLAIAAVSIFVYGISSSLSDIEPTYFYWSSIIGVLLSLGLGKLHVKPVQAGTMAAALGGTVIWILGAGIGAPLIRLAQAILALIPQIIQWLRFKTEIETSAITLPWHAILNASVTLGLRFQTWFAGWNQNVHLNDTLIRNMIWAFAIWLIAAWMGWFTARRRALLVMIPAMTLLAMITSYSEYKVNTLWGLLLVLLLLMGVWNYKNHTQQWQVRKIDFSDSILYDNTQAVLLLAVLIGVVAYVTPSVSWRAIRNYLQERSRAKNDMAEALGVKEGAGGFETITLPKPALPREHLLGGGFENSEKIVMTIRTGELPPISDPTIAARAPRYYWRSVVYDEYMGSGWITSSSSEQNLSANTPLIPGLLKDYRPLHLNVQMVEPQGAVFWSGTLFSANIPLTVEWRLKPTSNLFADQTTLLQSDVFAVPSNALTYQVESYLPQTTTDQLRAASATYPEAILNHYLALPLTTPARVRTLAKQITNGLSHPYDKAIAIENYLRNNYPYDINVPAPPADQDVADYFLFDLKKGYCDYYATAMVVLARASGLPARFVSGYAPGQYDAPNAEYVVRELDAHSWAEIYFPEIGWIEFEPTASIPAIVHGSQLALPTTSPSTEITAPKTLLHFRIEKIGTVVFPLFLILFVVLFYFALLEKWFYARLAPAHAIEKIYQKFYQIGRPLAGTRSRAETAGEFSVKIVNAIHEQTKTTHFKNFYAGSPHQISTLTEIYQTILFRDVQPQQIDFQSAWAAWHKLRWRLWFVRLSNIDLNRVLHRSQHLDQP